MLNQILEKNVVIYILLSISAIGMIVRLILAISYNNLFNNSFSMSETENKLLNHVKKKYEACFNLELPVYNVDTFVDKAIFKHKSCGILLSTWEKTSGQTILIQLLITALISLWAYVLGCGQDLIIYNLSVAISLIGFLYFVDNNMNLKYKRSCIKVNIIDYLDNYYYDKLQNKTIISETMQDKTKELIKALSEVAVHKDSPNKYETIHKKEENDFDEKIIEEVLKEFFT